MEIIFYQVQIFGNEHKLEVDTEDHQREYRNSPLKDGWYTKNCGEGRLMDNLSSSGYFELKEACKKFAALKAENPDLEYRILPMHLSVSGDYIRVTVYWEHNNKSPAKLEYGTPFKITNEIQKADSFDCRNCGHNNSYVLGGGCAKCNWQDDEEQFRE